MEDINTDRNILSEIFNGEPISKKRIKKIFEDKYQLPALNLHEDLRFLSYYQRELKKKQLTFPSNQSLNKTSNTNISIRLGSILVAHTRMRSEHPFDYEKYKNYGLYYKELNPNIIVPDPNRDPLIQKAWADICKPINEISDPTSKRAQISNDDFKSKLVSNLIRLRESDFSIKSIYYSKYSNHPLFHIPTSPKEISEEILEKQLEDAPITEEIDNNMLAMVDKQTSMTYNTIDYSISASAPEVKTSQKQYHTTDNYPYTQRVSQPKESRRSQHQNNKNLIDKYNSFRKANRLFKASKKAIKLIRGAKTTTTIIATSEIWIPILIVILFFLFIATIILMAIFGLSEINKDRDSQNENSSQSKNPIPGLNLEISGPSSMSNGDNIIYTITTYYGGSLDVTVIDALPSNTQYVEASGIKVVDNTNGQVSWRLAENTPSRVNEVEGLNVYTFTLKVKPTQDDIYIENSVFATAPGGTTGPAPETNDFSTLMQGQGRNTSILGDENNFVNTAIKNYSQFGNNQSEYIPYLKDIYEISLTYQVNPAIVLTIWGVEQSFAINGREFGCKPFDTGFATQVDCSAKTLDSWMKHFDEIKTQQSGQLPIYYKLETSCPFWDPFVYAYEAYTPVCSMNDGNDGSRKNFVDIYKQLLYGVQ